MIIYFIIILTLILFCILLYFSDTETNTKRENYEVCKNTPRGPYSTKCTLINFNNNVLSAYCANNNNDQKLVFSRLEMDSCDDSNNCSDVSVDNDGSLVC
jgi:hypothetical protein